LITGRSYVGSSIDLTKRLRDYFSPKRLSKTLLKKKSLIYKAILKDGYNNFTLEILEYCNPEDLIIREQYYINTINPKYNICKIAGSSYGRIVTVLTRQKISIALKARIRTAEEIARYKNREFTPEVLVKLKNSIIKAQLVNSHITIVTNIVNGLTSEYSSIRETARSLDVSYTTLRFYIQKGKILNNTYLITKKL
jgi:group I intron endonuclease